MIRGATRQQEGQECREKTVRFHGPAMLAERKTTDNDFQFCNSSNSSRVKNQGDGERRRTGFPAEIKLIGGFINAKTRRGKGKPLPVTYWMPSNATSNTSVLFGGIAGLGLFGP
jgi:hypothetical protein